VELLFRERDAAAMDDFKWPYSTYAGAHSICRNIIASNALDSLAIYVNEIPPKGKVDVTLSPVIALPQVIHELNQLELEVNGKIIRLPMSMESGQVVELESEQEGRLYSQSGQLLERFRPVCPDGWPSLNSGDNALRFHGESIDTAFSARAEVTAIAMGTPFGTRSAAVNWDMLRIDYDMPRTIFQQDGHDNVWSICQRDEQGQSPNDTARLSVDIQVDAVGGIQSGYHSPNGSKLLDGCQDVACYQTSNFNDYAKFAYDSENQGTAKPGVTFDIAHVDSEKSADGALRFNARSQRMDASGWAAVGRRFETPLDISGAKALACWLKGDASGATFKIQLRDVNGLWHDMVTSVTFSGWKFIEFPLDNLQLDPTQIAYILYYYNNLPAGRTIDNATTDGFPVSCVVDDVKVITQNVELDTPIFTVNGQTVRFPVKLRSGHRLSCNPQGKWLVKDDMGNVLSNGELESPMPSLRPGANPAALTFQRAGSEFFRVTICTAKEY
jgi:hypothetical protein